MGSLSVSLAVIDYIIIAIYLVGTMTIGLVLSKRMKSADDFFLAGRSMIWPFVGLSLFASNISSSTLVGLAGDAYSVGISVFNYEWMAALILIVFAAFFLPIFLRSRVFTMPEFLARRYDGRARTYLSVLTLFLSVAVDTAAGLYAGALVIKLAVPGLPLWQCIAALAVFAGIYTMAGGLAAVIYTDALQGVLLLVGCIVVSIVALNAAGGWGAVIADLDPEKLSLIRPLDDPGVPWLGLLTGVPLLGFYYWATHQTIVQRVLASKSVEHGRWGALFAGALKILPLFIMVFPGTIAIALYPALENPDLVYPRLMFDYLPAGLLGLTLAGFLAAIMSAIDSELNSASTLVTMDFVRPRFPNLSSEQLVLIGRIVMAVFVLIAVLWAPQIERFDSLFRYLQTVLSYFAPPVVALFVLGVFWPRANARGAIFGIVTGLGSGIGLIVAIYVLQVFELHFLYAAPLVFMASAIAIVLGSLSAPPPDPKIVEALCWSRKRAAIDGVAPARPVWQRFYVQAWALIFVLVVLVIIFW